VKKRGLIILGVIALLGTWAFVVGYEFLEKENALFQKKVKAAREEQHKCEARMSKFRNFDQFRTGIRLPYTSDLPLERWMQQFSTLHAGMSESEVEIVMGAPDYARCEVSEKGDRFVGAVWQYAVAVPKDAANDGENSALRVIFGPDGKLTNKDAMNMQPKPSPTPTVAPVATPSPESSPSPAALPAATATPVASPVPVASPTPTPETKMPALAHVSERGTGKAE
jgi:outer membrane protein assembly factor BamE (lipoprotein component of BamABCDE complex)